MPRIHKKLNQRKDNNRVINYDRPIKARDRHRRRNWEECEHERHAQKHNSNAIHISASLAEGPTTGGEGLAPPALEADAGDGDNIGGKQGANAEGDNGIEGDGGANVDEGERQTIIKVTRTAWRRISQPGRTWVERLMFLSLLEGK